MKAKAKTRLLPNDYTTGILSGNRILLSRAITLIESSLTSDRKLAERIIEKILPDTGKSIRVGITGIPGVGKSTFVEVLGKFLTAQNKKVAVLAVDPSSQKTKGSILGDKTRMEELSRDPLAYVRPSATNNSLGGVTNTTRETILLCEAAGYDIILVETVGVGQSETAVRSMTDFFLLLMLPGSGDELQGIKKGIMEMADGITITKSDGDNLKKAKQAQSDFQHALHLFTTPESGLSPKVVLSSALEKKGIKETWQVIEDFKVKTSQSGFFKHQRDEQNLSWFHEHLDILVKKKVMQQKKSKTDLLILEKKILSSVISPGKAAAQFMKTIKLMLLIGFISQFAVAQNLSPQSRRTPLVSDLFNGMPIAKPASEVVGDVYLSSGWNKGSLLLYEISDSLDGYFIRYDMQSSQLEIKTPAGVRVLQDKRIKSFHFKDSATQQDRKFINAKEYTKKDVPVNGFLEILTEGVSPLFKQHYLAVKAPDYQPALNSGSRDTRITKVSDLYYGQGIALLKITNAKRFLSSAGQQADKLAQYIKINKLSFKDERDLIVLFSHYNALLIKK